LRERWGLSSRAFFFVFRLSLFFPEITKKKSDAIFLGGALAEGTSFFIPLLAANTFDQSFDLPASRTRVRLARTNLPPRTIMRAPGTLQAALTVEAVLEAVAAATGVGTVAVRERNLLTHPLLAGPRKPCAGALAAGTHDAAADAAAAHGGDPHPSPADLADDEAMAGEVGLPPLKPDGTTDVAVTSAFGKELPLDQYSIPRLWAELKARADLDGRTAAVAAFNADPARPPWTKRGLAATACRFVMSVDPKPAIVSIHHDGSVLVNGPAHEMGQGAATKSLLAAAAALSAALTPASRAAHCDDGHLPLSLFRVADVSTDTLPNTGPSWGSTTSEAACEAVRQAAAELAAGLRPKCEELEKKAAAEGKPPPTWAELITAVHPSPGFSASTQPLTAYAFYDGTQRHAGGEGQAALSYNG
jgi:CO/xanthine dehydrogenase Mo-binding subunit